MIPEAKLQEVIAIQSEIGAASLDLSAVMQVITSRSQSLVGAVGAVIELAEDDEMVYRAASGIAENQLGLRLQREGSLSGLCVEQSAVLICEDSEHDDRVDREACRQVGLRSMVVVPLAYGGQTIGVLKVMGTRPGEFDDADGSLLQLLSGLIGAAVAHARRYESVAARADEFAYLATHDYLTGLANRSLFFDRVRYLQGRLRRYDERFAVVMIDLDGFKGINDTFGHRAGDEALRWTARRLASAVRELDLPARLGGDEFAVLGAPPMTEEGLEVLRRRVGAAVAGVVPFEGREFPVGASVGGVVVDSPDEAPEEVLARADAAMYRVKVDRTHDSRDGPAAP